VLRVLAGIALTLAAVGMFSVLAYTVDQRRAEFGVRLALGATPRHLVRLVLRRGVTLALAGVIIGVATSLILVRYLQSLLYETPPHDPVVLIGVSVILLAAAVLACLLPARRAGQVDVARLLRSE
jgi:ABC-type antimicrobial peptide transport system permease subunit